MTNKKTKKQETKIEIEKFKGNGDDFRGSIFTSIENLEKIVFQCRLLLNKDDIWKNKKFDIYELDNYLSPKNPKDYNIEHIKVTYHSPGNHLGNGTIYEVKVDNKGKVTFTEEEIDKYILNKK